MFIFSRVSRLLRNFRELVYRVNNLETIVRDQLRIIEHENLVYKNKYVSDDNVCSNHVIVSLTSYGNRLNEVHLAIESIFQQTVRPNKLILWLDKSYSTVRLPSILEQQKERGLEINYCNDLGPHTKLVPALVRFPDSVIITVDDDIIYPKYLVEKLINSYETAKSNIHFFRGHKMIFSRNGDLEPYSKWIGRIDTPSSILNFPTGVYGVLYPPKCFHEDVTDVELIRKYCPTADDVWFKFMSLLVKTECTKVEFCDMIDSKFTYVNTFVDSSLSKINNDKGENDKQIKNLWKLYKLSNILSS